VSPALTVLPCPHMQELAAEQEKREAEESGAASASTPKDR
jgi:hypothetical protein